MSDVSNWFAWVTEHYLALQEKYAGKYIVVHNNKVVAVGETSEEAVHKARLLLGEDEQLLIEFIESGDIYAFNTRINPSAEKSKD